MISVFKVEWIYIMIKDKLNYDFKNKILSEDQILLRKIATKLIRINKPKKARTIMNLKKLRFNQQYFINCIVYLLSYCEKKIYYFFHKNIIRLLKILRR